MPLPTPKANEAQDAFIGRCMSDDTAMADFPEQDQRLAVCFRQWRGEGKSASPPIGLKTFGSLEIKDGEKGEVSAVVSTFNVVDRDGDVILPGAIKHGTKVKLSHYGHSSAGFGGEAPVGKGSLEVTAERVLFTGRFFMTTERGREAFHTMKELGNDSEWSIGFMWSDIETEKLTEGWLAKNARRLIKRLTVLEVSPVFVGANQYTATVSVKCDGCTDEACACHTTPVDPEIQAAREAATKAVADAAEAEAKAKEEAAQRAAKEQADNEARALALKTSGEEFERFARTRRKYAL